MRGIAFIILVSFIAIAVFGFVGMGMDHGEMHRGCIAAQAQGTAACPGDRDPMGALRFHLDAFKGFSTATVVGVLFTIFVAFGASVALGARDVQSVGGLGVLIFFGVLFFAFHSLRETLRRYTFLALLEHSPEPF